MIRAREFVEILDSIWEPSIFPIYDIPQGIISIVRYRTHSLACLASFEIVKEILPYLRDIDNWAVEAIAEAIHLAKTNPDPGIFER